MNPVERPHGQHPDLLQVAQRHTDWRGLKASERAQPLTDLGRRLLDLHLTTTTPKEN